MNKSKKSRNLFIIGSPFQALCMLSITKKFNISNYDVIIQHCDDNSVRMIERLLNELKIRYSVQSLMHIIKDVIKGYSITKTKYDNVHIGNYYDVSLIAFSILITNKNGSISFFDDGTQALEIFSNNPRSRTKNWKVNIVFTLYLLVAKLKNINLLNFYSIYPISSTKYRIHNYSLHIKDHNSTEKATGIYIIGTNSSVLEFESFTYNDLLLAVIKSLKSQFPNQKIYYCPHRRDTNNFQIELLCRNLSVDFYNTRISVEYDFIKDNINPISVIGFTSNALFTLKYIYPKSDVRTIYYQLADRKANEETMLIRNRMTNLGISMMCLNNEI